MRVWRTVSGAAVLFIAALPLDGEPLARRFYYHFVGNTIYDSSRVPFVIPHLSYQLTGEDTADLLSVTNYRIDGRMERSASDFASEFFRRAFPKWVIDKFVGGTVNGTVAYAWFIEQDRPSHAQAMRRVRDRVLEHLNLQLTAMGLPILYPVRNESLWAAFSVTSIPSMKGNFEWHYDAESIDEYRVLYVVQGGDDCGEAAVKYRDVDGSVQEIKVGTGQGYLIRGSTTFHAVSGGGCKGASEDLPWIRHVVGFQLSSRPNRRPVPLCAILLHMLAWAHRLVLFFLGT